MLRDGALTLVQSNAILVHLATRIGGWGAEDEQVMHRCLEWLFWEANKIGMCLPQLRAAQRFAAAHPGQGALDWLLARYRHDVALLDAELADGRAFMIGDAPTIADFSLSGYLFFADEARVEVPSHVQIWLNRLAALPGWQHPYDLMAE